MFLMALPSSSPEKTANRRSKTGSATESQSQLRIHRIRRGLSQAALAKLAGMHRHSIRKIENGTTQEVTFENASALAAALKTSIAQLEIRVLPAAAARARAIQIRRLTPDQRQLVNELLSLPPEDYVLIRGAIERLRKKRTNQGSRGTRK
jgi:transcriptional regulator with XRE-family HTH domain